MYRVEAVSRASPAAAWRTLAEPARWSSWAPHIRGSVGLGSPEVQLGRRGLVFVAYVAAVPVRVSAKDPGRSWEWTTGPVRFRHIVEPRDDGCVVGLELVAPAPLEQLLRVTYGPLIGLVIRRLAEVAGD